MGGKSSRNKGANGEREFIAIMQETVNNVFKPGTIVLKRNLFQTQEGGADVAGFPDWLDKFAIEIKRQERLCIPQWWKQALKQRKAGQRAVLTYRQNNKKWLVIVEGPFGTCIVHAHWFTLPMFEHWLKQELLWRKDKHDAM